MPIPLSQQDRLLSWLDSLDYAANRTFMLRERQIRPGAPIARRNRRDLVERLRRISERIIIPVPISWAAANDREHYAEMVSLIRSLRTTITDKFNNAADQKKVVDDFVNQVMHPMFEVVGCGDLCYVKDKGCVECPPEE